MTRIFAATYPEAKDFVARFLRRPIVAYTTQFNSADGLTYAVNQVWSDDPIAVLRSSPSFDTLETQFLTDFPQAIKTIVSVG